MDLAFHGLCSYLKEKLKALSIILLIIWKWKFWVWNLSLQMPKTLISLIGPTLIFLIMIPIVQTMRASKCTLLNLFGHQRPNPVQFHLSSRFKRISRRSWNLLLMFLSVIEFLINCLKTGTSDYHMLYRRPRSLSDMHIVSSIILYLMRLMIIMFFVDRYNRLLMNDDWYFLRCRLTRLLSLFICWN